MASIEGLDKGVKQELIDFCQRQEITQVRWVAQHLLNDLEAEKKGRKIHGRKADLPQLPAATKRKREDPGVN